ncbi:PAS domain-containing sensor histidine kinase [Methanonatronarchaeum sp. AMET-Sl]|uniref:PAS domain-containing sensor histidine kinase n=1 Tax=Methanonatronarchaeum sp. AMET-Sl TaxID=3037654 RepID=UPI00244E5405|nr:PAS domain-containing sensor histidine kinase [Methanonatronarchaeum sp. AMET-Sl]WGI16920.1 PAS domain-containing sensor histidine kinase [Methanonatronarchaeum sp. AMET-Sl]
MEDPMPLLHRVIGSSGLLGFFVLSYISSFVKDNITDLMYLIVVLGFTQLTYMAYIYDYTLNYALSILLVALIINLIFDANWKLRLLNLYLFLAILTTLFISSPQVNIPVYLTAVLILIGASYLISHSKYLIKLRLNELFKNSPIGLIELNNQGKILKVNKKTTEILGIPEKELLGPKLLKKLDIELDSSGEGVQKIKIKDNELWIEYKLNKTPNKIERYILSLNDVTDRKKAIERRNLIEDLIEHDIQNKIMVINGYLDLFQQKNLSKKQQKYLNKIKTSQKELEYLINNIKILKKADKADKKTINIQTMVNNITKKIEKKLENQEIEITNKIPKNTKTIGGEVIRDVIKNIIENAIQHSDCDKIKITTQTTPNNIKINIEDNGTGVPPETREKIFEPGYTTDREQGLGHGLYLSQKIIENYEGSITYSDSDLGGSKFQITLPKPKNK